MKRARDTTYLLGVFAGLLSASACGHTVSVPAAAANPPNEPQQPTPQCPADDLEQVFADQDRAPVIVVLHASSDSVSPDAQISHVVQQLGDSFTLERRYDSLPGFAGTLTRDGLPRARAQAEVRCVQLDRPGSGGG